MIICERCQRVFHPRCANFQTDDSRQVKGDFDCSLCEKKGIIVFVVFYFQFEYLCRKVSAMKKKMSSMVCNK